MVEPLRHRQTKGAETDMPGLPPPRHISTLPTPAETGVGAELPQCAESSHQDDEPANLSLVVIREPRLFGFGKRLLIAGLGR